MNDYQYDEFGELYFPRGLDPKADAEWDAFQKELDEECSRKYKLENPEPTIWKKMDEAFGFLSGCAGLYIICSFIYHFFV